MLKATFKQYRLQFKTPVLTSRGEMKVKNGYFLSISDGIATGTGECSFIEGLSLDNLAHYEEALRQLRSSIETGDKAVQPNLLSFPSLAFAMECAMMDLQHGGKKILFDTDFTQGKRMILINGLVWMGTPDFMQQQIDEKLKAGFRCIKIKVGAIDFEEETKLLQTIRNKFPSDRVEIRLDANGAFTNADVFHKLDILAKYSIHSIEQPVKPGQPDLMKRVCSFSPIPIALDEELIGVAESERPALLSLLRPQYLVLKPSLLGGFASCDQWIDLARKTGIAWWATSALESNIGLNAIAQWASTKDNSMVHGLGTGGLYENNIPSPLFIAQGSLGYNPGVEWGEIPISF
jgi:O-succinylbenzoate synthase